jgi:hypothetical protein
MTPSPCVKPFELASCSLMSSPVDRTDLRQRKTERWNGITPRCVLIDGRYDEEVSRPQTTREQDCRKRCAVSLLVRYLLSRERLRARPFRTKGLTLREKLLRGREHGQKRGNVKVCSAVEPASPVHMVKLVKSRTCSLTRCKATSTVAYLAGEQSPESVIPHYAQLAFC